ncbi:MAG: tRNA (adenosine(37)-N6)-dimethylallyltransferase MiaA [Candidatus Pelagibacter sp.]|nr:tRNA (adenosine(37)-N6)-dimethylallyltransferase MiaA [Candidatus Pelagibacter sp.]
MSKKIILLFGPTASGKSKVAIDIAKKFNGEILNADSMQVYKEIKILSARPNKSKIKHHFYGFISAKDTFSVGKWYKMVSKKIKEIKKRKKVPIVVGGTGLYFRALTEGLVEIPKVKKIDYSYLNPIGRWMMGNHYYKKNPTIFEGIDRNDIQRVSRAISVYEGTGLTLKEWQNKENKKYFNPSDFIKLCILPSKNILEKKITKRFNQMLKNGALQEVRKYKKKFLEPASYISANSIIGIYEIGLYIDKSISIKDLKERVLIRTRQYAKRQYTWQRGQMKDWKQFTDTNYLDLRKKILSYLSKT